VCDLDDPTPPPRTRLDAQLLQIWREGGAGAVALGRGRSLGAELSAQLPGLPVEVSLPAARPWSSIRFWRTGLRTLARAPWFAVLANGDAGLGAFARQRLRFAVTAGLTAAV